MHPRGANGHTLSQSQDPEQQKIWGKGSTGIVTIQANIRRCFDAAPTSVTLGQRRNNAWCIETTPGTGGDELSNQAHILLNYRSPG